MSDSSKKDAHTAAQELARKINDIMGGSTLVFASDSDAKPVLIGSADELEPEEGDE
jgi:hypothetical protein